MRYNLINARVKKGLSILEVSKILNISERMYRYIESGKRIGNYEIWDKLEDLLEIHQRQLREINTSNESLKNHNTTVYKNRQ